MILYAILGLAAAGLEAACLGMLLLGNLKVRAIEYILLAFGSSILYLISVWLVTRLKPSKGLLAGIFVAGMVFRATLVPLYPSLSDDLLRYRWEGWAQAQGFNPYMVTPLDPQTKALRDPTWPAVNGKAFATVYGPITELAFRAAWLVAGPASSTVASVLWMKLPSLLFDLAAAALLVVLLGRLGLPATRVVVYWWCPLTVVEFAASGHNDSLAIFFLIAAMLAAERSKPALSLAALAASTLCKLFAVFLAPVLLVRERARLLGPALLAPLLLAGAVYFPFRNGMSGVIGGMTGYAWHWRNNDSLFAAIAWLCRDSLPIASKIYAGIVAGTALYVAYRRVPLPRAAFLIIGTMLAFSANCFPWYLTWMLPMLAIEMNVAWLLLTGTSALAYHVLIPYGTLGLWQEDGFIRVLEYAPFYVLLIGNWLRTRNAK